MYVLLIKHIMVTPRKARWRPLLLQEFEAA